MPSLTPDAGDLGSGPVGVNATSSICARSIGSADARRQEHSPILAVAWLTLPLVCEYLDAL